MNNSPSVSSAKQISGERPRRSLWARFRSWEWLLIGLILLVIAYFSQISPFFLRVNNLARASSDFMEIGIMMLPMVFVIITGNIDLSVASVLGMSASFMGFLFNQGVNIWMAAGATLILGAVAGWFNGWLVARIKLPSLVVTLGTYAFYRGIAYVLLGDQAARGYPSDFTFLGQGRLFGTPLPVTVLIFAVLAVIFGLVLHRTTFGRYLYAIGKNEEAALYAGVPVARVKLIIFTLSGLLAALAGVLMAARFGSTRPDIGLGLELTVITVTVLGGINIFGGSGTLIGAVLALLLIGLMRFGMGLINIQGQVQSIAVGLLLIGAILVPNFAQQIANLRENIDRSFIVKTIVTVAIAATFWWFFFWSRQI